jgi:DNA-binding CsgD family transcriptional regulator
VVRFLSNSWANESANSGSAEPEQQIAANLGISEITVKAHRGQVMRKMRVDSLAELVRVAAALDVPLVAHA